MEATKEKTEREILFIWNLPGKIRFKVFFMILAVFFLFTSNPVWGHCDSYDGPVIIDAKNALETNDPKLVFKWISKEQESEIESLFRKTFTLKNGDQEIYQVVEKYFFETLVRLHRETEGAPYTGLKAPGSAKQIVQMSDHALSAGNIDDLLVKLFNHTEEVILQKFNKAAMLSKTKDESVEAGRDYVRAYVDYTHTLEAFHDILEHGNITHSDH